MITKGGKIIGTFQIRTIASLLASPNVNFFYIDSLIYFFPSPVFCHSILSHSSPLRHFE